MRAHGAARPLLLLALLTALACRAGYYRIFTGFAPYDDEGYLMITLKYFLQGRPLYDDVFTQYGPAYYLIRAVFSPLVSVTHDEGRLFSLAAWLGTALLLSLFTYRLTRSAALAALAHLLSFFLLGAMTKEPGHPQELCVLILALAAALSTTGRGLPLIGLLAAVLVLIKVNIGVYLLLGVCLLLPGRARLFALAASLLLPAFLMRHHARAAWGFQYWFVSTAAVAGAAVVMLRRADLPRLKAREAYLGAAAFVAAGAAVCGATLLHGTSVRGFVSGVLLQPLKFSTQFWIPLGFNAASIPCAAAAVALAVGAAGSRRLTAGLQVAFGLAVSCMALAERGDLLLLLAAPFLWLALLKGSFPAVLVGCVALLQILQAFPVAGTQLSTGTVLIVPLGLYCLREGLGELVPAERARRLWRAGAPAVVALAAAVYVGKGLSYQTLYASRVPLGLPGAARVRLAPEDAATYACVARKLSACETFVSVPGIYSLNFWAQREPPTRLNATAWPLLFGDEQQRRVADALSQFPAACVLATTSSRFLEEDYPSLLLRHVKENFRAADRVGDFVLLTRDGGGAARVPPCP